jgi:hypothetical protein
MNVCEKTIIDFLGFIIIVNKLILQIRREGFKNDFRKIDRFKK